VSPGVELRISDTPPDASFTLSEPVHMTYTDLFTQINNLTSALLHLGFTNPSTPIAQRPRVSIYAETSMNWQLMAQSFTRLGHVITTAYPTLGEEGLLVSLVEPEVEMVFCGEEQLGLVAKVIGRADRVKWLVWDGTDERVDRVSQAVS
jgi:long-chain acyl-CoA synthetase